MTKEIAAKRIREAIEDKTILAMTEPFLRAYEEGLQTVAELDEMALAIAKRDSICRRLMTVPAPSQRVLEFA